MTLIGFFVTVIILGLLFWFVETYIPMSPPFKAIVRIVSVIIAILLVLALFGIVEIPRRLY